MSKLGLFSRVTVKSPTLSMGGRGLSTLTNEEIIGALAGIPSLAADWIYFHYMNDRSIESRVIGNLYLDSAAFAKSEGFRMKADTVYGLVKAIIFEVSQPACPTCHGVGIDYFDHAGQPCKSCAGTGRRRLSVSEVSRQAMISKQSFTDNHRSVMNYIASVIGEMERLVSAHVSRHLADE